MSPTKAGSVHTAVEPAGSASLSASRGERATASAAASTRLPWTATSERADAAPVRATGKPHLSRVRTSSAMSREERSIRIGYPDGLVAATIRYAGASKRSKPLAFLSADSLALLWL
jgi:hypothetical protein